MSVLLQSSARRAARQLPAILMSVLCLLPIAPHFVLAQALENNTNAWLLDATSGSVLSTFNLLDGAWLIDAEPHSLAPVTRARIFDETAQQTILGGLMLDSQALVINRTQAGIPDVGGNLAAVSLAGLAVPVGSADTAQQPGISIAPAPGSYNNTIAISLMGFPGRGNDNPVTVHWRINDGPAQSRSVSDEAPSAQFFLTTSGLSQIDFWATQGAAESQPNPQTASYTLTQNLRLERDTDQDGVPDIVEATLGLNPLLADLSVNTDSDGWSDFDEIVRGSDPTDAASQPALVRVDSDGDGCSDLEEAALGTDPNDPALSPSPCDAGFVALDADDDGWSDFDEEVRMTDPHDATSFPSATRLNEVEYLIEGNIYRAVAATVRQHNLAELTAHTLDGTLLYDVRDRGPFSGASALATLAEGSLPEGLRLPAGALSVLRVRQWIDTRPGSWIATRVLPAQTEASPQAALDWMTDNAIDLSTAARWRDAYQNYLRSALVRRYDASLSPRTTAVTALFEDAVVWHTDGPLNELVLFGEDLSGDAIAGVALLAGRLATQGRTPSNFVLDLSAVVESTEALVNYLAAVDNAFGEMPDEGVDTTTRRVAMLLQGGGEDGNARNVARLLTYAAHDSLDEALYSDLTGDFDGDGITNAAELDSDLNVASSPLVDDTDGDALLDRYDPCPAQSDNACLSAMHQLDDADDDRIEDSLDNCLRLANNAQKDTVGNGIGDACRLPVNIRMPSTDLTVWTGSTVAFAGLSDNELITGRPVVQWRFDGAAPDSNVLSPGEVVFEQVGEYRVELDVLDPINNRLVGTQYRMIHVIGNVD